MRFYFVQSSISIIAFHYSCNLHWGLPLRERLKERETERERSYAKDIFVVLAFRLETFTNVIDLNLPAYMLYFFPLFFLECFKSVPIKNQYIPTLKLTHKYTLKANQKVTIKIYPVNN